MWEVVDIAELQQGALCDTLCSYQVHSAAAMQQPVNVSDVLTQLTTKVVTGKGMDAAIMLLLI
jgi:hypothetical protein